MALPAIHSDTALFLDFDGTLVDLADQPESVRVPSGLVPVLRQLAQQLKGALAIVSGRKLADLDQFLSPLQLPCAAEHGAHYRYANGSQVQAADVDLAPVIRQVLALVQRHPGLQAEVKASCVALHYRHAPQLQALAHQVMQQAASSCPGLSLLSGKMVFEIKPSHVSKGRAIEDFMQLPPFSGRKPTFIGDDVTDEAGFAAVQALGGTAIKVGLGDTLARHRCDNPTEVRHWLGANLSRLTLTLPTTENAP
ncbi:MAG: trehalose-phosphatase [Polaromonas sp.]|nr:trehalose-phosphatase [Polaromonas sp.]